MLSWLSHTWKMVLLFFGLVPISALREEQKRSSLQYQKKMESERREQFQKKRAERWKREAVDCRKALVNIRYSLDVPSRERMRGASVALKAVSEALQAEQPSD